MNEKRYTQLITNIKAPQSAVDKAVERMYEFNGINLELKNKSRYKNVFGIAAVAAVLCMVILAGFVFYPFGSKSENAFIINAGATELNTYELVELGELKCEHGSFGLGYNEEGKLTEMVVLECLDFPITCIGDNIEKVTFTVNGKGFFLLPDNTLGIYDKQEFKDTTVILPYIEGFEESLKSFSTDARMQYQEWLLCMYTYDKNGRYCQMYNDTEKKEDAIHRGKDFDYQQMYYELFNADDYSVDVTATFSDGSTQTKTIKLAVDIIDKPTQRENKKTLVISAVLAE